VSSSWLVQGGEVDYPTDGRARQALPAGSIRRRRTARSAPCSSSAGSRGRPSPRLPDHSSPRARFEPSAEAATHVRRVPAADERREPWPKFDQVSLPDASRAVALRCRWVAQSRGRDSFPPVFPRDAGSSCDAALRSFRRGLETVVPRLGDVGSNPTPSVRTIGRGGRDFYDSRQPHGHKALNLALHLPDPSECRRSAHVIRKAGRSGPGGQCVCCHGVVTGTLSAARSRVTPLESYPGNKRSGAEKFGHDEHGESKTSGRLALIVGRRTARRGRWLAVTVIGPAIGFHLVSLQGWRHTAAYVW
jgi:hypothetical protein